MPAAAAEGIEDEIAQNKHAYNRAWQYIPNVDTSSDTGAFHAELLR